MGNGQTHFEAVVGINDTLLTFILVSVLGNIETPVGKEKPGW